MEYTKTYKELRALFSQDVEYIQIPGSDISIRNLQFTSLFADTEFINRSDRLISENRNFTYPVFVPKNHKNKKAILLMHGLNERSWIKYLVWAFWLAEETGNFVILFPISFHINRSPGAWSDPRKMISEMNTRCSSGKGIKLSSFANAALSNRLTEYPLRFFNSGYQTSSDIVNLLMSIREGSHPIIPKESNIDIFAYSIGAFLAEIMLMGNPENLFTNSRLFIFCGGSVFSNMRGSSRLIMDSLAFDRVYAYYMNDFEKTLTGKGVLTDFLRNSPVGLAFRSMIDLGRLKKFRENILYKLRGQIYSVSLKNDAVIPAEGVVATLNTDLTHTAEIWDFQYPYSHENPFPLFDSPLSTRVDLSFEKVFSEAARFFNQSSLCIS